MEKLIILDGGTGRELARRGAPFRQPEWSALSLIEAPHFVSAVHQAYVEAGADVITTNSYAVAPFHIGDERFADQGEALADRAGRLAWEAAQLTGGRVKVAAGLPPTCGSYRADLFDPAVGRPILEVLVKGLRRYADHWQAETLSAIEEAELVRSVLGDDPRPLWLSFTLQDEDVVAGAPQLRSGQSVDEAVDAAVRLGATALLFNCSQPEVMADAVAAARARLNGVAVRIGVYANGFPPQPKTATANDGLDEIRADLTPERYLAFAKAWRDEGASIIGGCCGVGPEHIARLVELGR